MALFNLTAALYQARGADARLFYYQVNGRTWPTAEHRIQGRRTKTSAFVVIVVIVSVGTVATPLFTGLL